MATTGSAEAFAGIATAARKLHGLADYWSAHLARSVFAGLQLRCPDVWGPLAKMTASVKYLGPWKDRLPSELAAAMGCPHLDAGALVLVACEAGSCFQGNPADCQFWQLMKIAAEQVRPGDVVPHLPGPGGVTAFTPGCILKAASERRVQAQKDGTHVARIGHSRHSKRKRRKIQEKNKEVGGPSK